MAGCRPLTDAEVQVVEQTFVNARDRALFVLGVYTGFRISELLSLRRGDVTDAGRQSSHANPVRRTGLQPYGQFSRLCEQVRPCAGAASQQSWQIGRPWRQAQSSHTRNPLEQLVAGERDHVGSGLRKGGGMQAG